MTYLDVCLVGPIGLSKELKGRETLPMIMFDEDKNELMEKSRSAILLCSRFLARSWKMIQLN